MGGAGAGTGGGIGAGGGRFLDFDRNIAETSSGAFSDTQPGLGIKPLAIITPPSTEEVVHHPILIVCSTSLLVTGELHYIKGTPIFFYHILYSVIRKGDDFSMPSPFLRVDTLFIPVKDLGKSVEWYTQTLEFGLNWRNDEGGYACIDGGLLPITLAQISQDKEFIPFINAPCNFFVQNVEEVHKSLKDKGVEVSEIDKLYEVQWFWFVDPDGNRLEVCSYEV